MAESLDFDTPRTPFEANGDSAVQRNAPSVARERTLISRLLQNACFYLSVTAPLSLYLLFSHFGYSPLKAPVNSSVLLLAPFAAGLTVVISTIWTIATIVGLFRFGPPRDESPGESLPWPSMTTLIVCYVSRGNQPAAMRHAALQTREVLDRYPIQYSIEFVTDIAIEAAERVDASRGAVVYEVVPPSYQTIHGAKYKARALQYMLERRTVRLGESESNENIWILHLDEESVLTPECLLGISRFVTRYDTRTTSGAIGQGEILYNAGRYGDNAWIEAVDAMRTGDDLGRFRFQMAGLHRPIFGIHGSFVLVPAKIEREVSWDVGGRGSVTEDAHFALSAMERGVYFDWVEGCIREQSPFTIRDILEQRRRWFCGLRFVATDPCFRLGTTLFLRASLLAWALGSMGLITAVLLLVGGIVAGGSILPYWLSMSMALCGGIFSSVYVLGAYRNVRRAEIPFSRRWFNVAFTFVACLCLWPAFVESISILYAMLFPVKTFYIVAKDVARFEMAVMPPPN